MKCIAVTVAALCFSASQSIADDASCRAVRFSDVGWTDITSVTAVASVLLEALGYEPSSTLLSIPVTYVSMEAGDIDAYLGDWQPSMKVDRQPYLDDKSIEVVSTNRRGPNTPSPCLLMSRPRAATTLPTWTSSPTASTTRFTASSRETTATA